MTLLICPAFALPILFGILLLVFVSETVQLLTILIIFLTFLLVTIMNVYVTLLNMNGIIVPFHVFLTVLLPKT
jgi:hypothetical protein